MVSVLYIQYSIWNYGLVPSFKLLKAETLRNLSSNCPPPSIHPPSRDCAESLSRVQLFATPWTVAHQPPLFMGFLFFQARILEWVAISFFFLIQGSNPGFCTAGRCFPNWATRWVPSSSHVKTESVNRPELYPVQWVILSYVLQSYKKNFAWCLLEST